MPETRGLGRPSSPSPTADASESAISEGYAAKFRRLGDQAGNAPWGMHRAGPAHTLEPDPSTIGDVVRAFEMWAAGNMTNGMIADEFGIGIERVRKALRNPIYNGWAVRHRGQDRIPAPWREHPPVDDILWERVQQVRDVRSRGGQEPGKWKRGVDPLGGLLWCICGKRVRTNGTAGSPPRRQRTHPDPVCDDWGGPRTQWGAFHDAPIAAQVTSIRLDDSPLAKVVRAVTQEEVPSPPSIDAARVARRRREVALDHAAGKINDEEYIAAARELRRAPPPEPVKSAVTADTAVGYLRDLGRVWEAANEQERADLLHAVYSRITIRRDSFESVELTPHAYAHGLALSMRETVLASPAVSEFRT